MISIIIPILNESIYIRNTIDAVLVQDCAQDQIEILIVDGMSTDDTREIVRGYQQDHPNIRMIDNPTKIVPTALNAAIRQANGDIIVRVDGHTIIAPDYLRKCVDTLHRTGADNVGGCMTAVGINPFGKAVALATSTPFGVGNSKFHYATIEEDTDSVYMGAWPKEVFTKFGLFDEELVRNQDDEFNYRIREKGGKIILNPEIRSFYTNRSSPLALWKQYFQYGFWKVRVLQKHPKQMSLRQLVPPLFVLSLFTSVLLALATSWGGSLLLVTTGSYLLANIIASIFIAIKKGWKHLPLLPLTFLILHVSYGFGFILGLIKFWNRWGDKIGKVPIINLKNSEDQID